MNIVDNGLLDRLRTTAELCCGEPGYLSPAAASPATDKPAANTAPAPVPLTIRSSEKRAFQFITDLLSILIVHVVNSFHASAKQSKYS